MWAYETIAATVDTTITAATVQTRTHRGTVVVIL
jgi:hypothetical protein